MENGPDVTGGVTGSRGEIRDVLSVSLELGGDEDWEVAEGRVGLVFGFRGVRGGPGVR